MYVNAKMIPFEPIPGMAGEGKGEQGRSKSKYDIFDTV
jgi:hypothetical protein